MDKPRGVCFPGTEVKVELVVLRCSAHRFGTGGNVGTRFRAFAGERCDESRPPRPPAIIRVGLLVVVLVGSDSRPEATNENRFVMKSILGEKLANTVFERTHQRCTKRGHFAVNERLAPLV